MSEHDMTAAIISASVAIVIFSLTQYLNFRNSHIDRYQKKLEEYYLALNDILNSTSIEFILSCESADELVVATNEAATMLSKASDIPHMYAHLYFPDTIPRFSRIMEKKMTYMHWLEIFGDPQKDADFGEGTDSLNHLVSAVHDLKKYLMENKNSLIRSIGHSFE